MLSQQLADFMFPSFDPQLWAACHLLAQQTSLPSEPCWPSDCSLLYLLTPALSSEMLKPSWSPATIFLENQFCKWYLSWYILHIVIDSTYVNVYIYISYTYKLVHDKYLRCLSTSKLNASLFLPLPFDLQPLIRLSHARLCFSVPLLITTLTRVGAHWCSCRVEKGFVYSRRSAYA